MDNQNIIKLDQFLKLIGVASTGGQAKMMIVDGAIKVNGVVENRRGRKLVSGDRVTVEEEISVNGSTSFDVENFIN